MESGETSEGSVSVTQCWVCYCTMNEDPHASWIRPCHCRGGLEWVHQQCLHRWIDEKQKGDASMRVSCSVCKFEYIIVYPPDGIFVMSMDSIDDLLTKSSPICIAVLTACSFYWTAVTFGAITVLQVLGHTEGLQALQRADPLMLLISLPSIPVVLVISRSINWQTFVLRMWRRYNRFLPLSQYIVPKGIPEWRRETVSHNTNRSDGLANIPRYIMGGLLLPTISTIVGKLLFSRVRSNLRRTILGLLTYIAVKGCFSLFYEEKKFIRNCQRKICHFDGSAVDD